MSATPFAADGSLDEPALRSHLRRLADAGIGVYLGSGGAGEGHALSPAELDRLYRVGVEECRGKTPAFANPPEARTADEMLSKTMLAVNAGIDCVQIYALDGGHGMRPTEAEQNVYYRTLLDAIDHPVAISVHGYQGYLTPIPLLQRLALDYPQLVAINVMVRPFDYFVELKDALRPDIAFYTIGYELIQGLALGAAGCLSAEPNLAPELCSGIATAFDDGDIAQAGGGQADLIRLGTLVNRWAPSTARWVKMGMKVLGLGNGVLRPPYLLPGQDQQDEMLAGLRRLGVNPVGD
ncbi:MAG: dihydrodipicolinate synthase family protein [Ilumatobacteraceae bacterium]